MAHHRTVRNEFRDYPREEAHEIPPPATLDEIGLEYSRLRKHIEDLTGRIAIKTARYEELLEEERQGKRYRAEMIDGDADVDDINSMTADLEMALVKVRALRKTMRSMHADGNDGARPVCAGTKGLVQEYVSCADYYEKHMRKAWDGKQYMEYARYATLLKQYQEDHDTVRVGMITNEFDDSWDQWRLRNPLHEM
jgi:hypothetical protein